MTNVFLGDAIEIERTFDGFARERNGGVIVTNNARGMSQRQLIGMLAARHHLPAVYPARVYPANGYLIFLTASIRSIPIGVRQPTSIAS